MVRILTEEEMLQIKRDKKARDKIKAELEELAQIGKPLSMTIDGTGTWTKTCHQVASEDAIRRFCDNLGNFSQLYRSRDYARKSVYGTIIAPPHFLSAVSIYGGVMYSALGGEHDVIRHAFNSGHTAEYFKIIRIGDKFTVQEVQTEVKDLTREDTGLQFLACAKKIYKNQRDEIVSIIDTTIMMIPVLERGKLPSGIAKRGPKVRRFSEQEIENWYQLMLEEPIRGATPRFWEDVNVGDELPPYHQVYSTMDYAGFEVAGSYQTTGDWRFRMTDEYLGVSWKWNTKLIPDSGLPEHAIGHLYDGAAHLEGQPRGYLGGTMMTCWIYNLITNWMGDTGFLKKIHHQYRRFMWRESLVLCKGHVIKKYIDGDDHLVDISTTLEDHNGDFQIPNGVATVILPTRKMEKLSYLVS